MRALRARARNVSEEDGRTSRERCEHGAAPRWNLGGNEWNLGRHCDLRSLRTAADCAEHRAERSMQVAQPVLLRRLVLLIALGADGLPARTGKVPDLMRYRGLLRKEQRGSSDQKCQRPGKHRIILSHFARHSSSPARKRSFGSFLPMNTSSDSFFSLFVQGLPMSPPIIMCTPWNTTRRGLPFIQSTPL